MLFDRLYVIYTRKKRRDRVTIGRIYVRPMIRENERFCVYVIIVSKIYQHVCVYICIIKKMTRTSKVLYVN